MVKNNNNWWQPALIFYGKVTSWIIAPLLLAFLFSKKFTDTGWFIVIIIAGFLITCFGIYREVKVYKKSIEGKSEGSDSKQI